MYIKYTRCIFFVKVSMNDKTEDNNFITFKCYFSGIMYEFKKRIKMKKIFLLLAGALALQAAPINSEVCVKTNLKDFSGKVDMCAIFYQTSKANLPTLKHNLFLAIADTNKQELSNSNRYNAIISKSGYKGSFHITKFEVSQQQQ